MPIIALWGSSPAFLSRRVASTPPARTGPARVHVERFAPKAGKPRPPIQEYPIDGPATDPLTPVTAAPGELD
jgi:hypothetical protein